MKKHLFYLWLIALTGLITSCSQDETDTPEVAGESNRVSFTASLPADFAQPGTRALPAQTGHDLRCILEVWNRETPSALIARIEKTGLTGDNVVFDFEIAQGTYDCLFWADFIATGAAEKTDAQIGGKTYTHYADKYYKTDDETNGLKAVSIITDAYAFNTDARDAFFGKYELQKGVAAITEPLITLTRPFAKLTIKEKTPDAYNLCKTMTASYDVPKTFNVLTRAAATDTYTASYAAAPAGDGSSDLTLFSDYIFTTTNTRETMPEISLTFTKQDEATAELQPVTIPAGVPVRRNYRTNAAGSLISAQPAPTNGVKLTVSISENWSDDEYFDLNYPTVPKAKELIGTEVEGGDNSIAVYHVFNISTADQLRALHVLVANSTQLSQGSTGGYRDATYRLMADINLENAPWIPIGSGISYFNGIFDGQGHTVSGLNVSGSWSEAGFFSSVGGSATVRNLRVKGSVTNNGAYTGGITGRCSNRIAFCSFEGTLSSSNEKAYVGGISGFCSLTPEITACFANTTQTVGSAAEIKQGGIIGYSLTDITIKGCTWNYDSSASTGIETGYNNSGSSTATQEKNATFDGANLSADRISEMNSCATNDDAYRWEADGANSVKLVLKAQ